MSAQHTPGPWTLNTQYAETEVRGPAESGVLIAVMSPWGIAADTPSPQAANARLIAAAPELLLALEFLLAWHLGTSEDAEDEENYSAVRDARAVIAKATGSAA